MNAWRTVAAGALAALIPLACTQAPSPDGTTGATAVPAQLPGESMPAMPSKVQAPRLVDFSIAINAPEAGIYSCTLTAVILKDCQSAELSVSAYRDLEIVGSAPHVNEGALLAGARRQFTLRCRGLGQRPGLLLAVAKLSLADGQRSDQRLFAIQLPEPGDAPADAAAASTLPPSPLAAPAPGPTAVPTVIPGSRAGEVPSRGSPP